MKTDREETLRTSAKLFLNSLYGTMPANTDSSFKVAHMQEDDYVGFNTINFVIRAAQANYYGADKAGFIYADTDSIHCEICKEYRGNDCKYCQLGNPCIGCVDYDIENDTCKSEGACADVGINRKLRINKVSKYEK